MALLDPATRPFAEAVSSLVYCNPFLPQRLEHERQALDDAYVESPPVWSLQPEELEERANLALLQERVEPLATALRAQLIAGGGRPSERELTLYEDLVLYLLYERCRNRMHEAIARRLAGGPAALKFSMWRSFRAEFEHHLHLPGVALPSGHEAAHVFACYFQIRRAFSHIYLELVGGSMPAAKLRATVWQSIFTHDLRRYYLGLYRHMADYTTLITGESGTGKELVARAIGRSRYIPFDAERERFEEDFAGGFFPLNLAALSPTLIESELFGHARGAYTGAVADRAGWLESCPRLGAVFLDEVGELAGAIQVKLLRVLQDRTFQRLGETTARRFDGKLLAATNRDLAAEMHAGRFRPDLYYRLCADLVRTPSLREQLADRPTDLGAMVRMIACRAAGDAGAELAPQMQDWIESNLGIDYAWPGNFRELEQCVRNLIIRGGYRPAGAEQESAGAIGEVLDAVRHGTWTADELLSAYCTMIYAGCGSFSETGRRLGLDRRTVASRLDRALLDRLALTSSARSAE